MGYRHFNGLKLGLISTHISSFIKIGRKNDQVIVGESHFFDQNHSSVKGGQPCGTRLRGTEAHLNTYLHSKFHQDWSRNAQVMTRKLPMTTIDRQIERKKERNLSRI